MNKLKKIPVEKYEQIKFKLNPACRVLSCQYAILEHYQSLAKAAGDFHKKKENILIIRRSLDITFEQLTAGEFALLSAFNKGLMFKKACALALKSDITFNVESYLKQSVLQKIIVDFL